MDTNKKNRKNSPSTEARTEKRTEAARLFFRTHHAQVEPDAGFAVRVAAQLDRKPVDLMSSAALKLLPGTLALVLILAWFASRTPEPSVNSATSSSDDLLTWVLDESSVESINESTDDLSADSIDDPEPEP